MDYVVVDSSVAIKWLVVETHSTEARRVLDEYQAGSLTLLAPDLINAEVGNVVWKKHRFQGMAATDAQLILDAFRTLSFVLTPTAALLDDAYRLAVAHRRTVYDAMYLALSVREKCRLVTADEKLVNALASAFPNLVWVANWP
ncbi:MAG TPA: type II toxin-antitoxin system VapC family toxin [Gemmataceae bacterium]|jgi:predicted nucleic acid-binding protein|nr:type II toxin-antitoxin system VapC family toxin [Gemmataceae bacterium]